VVLALRPWSRRLTRAFSPDPEIGATHETSDATIDAYLDVSERACRAVP
jgi:hypothetical protein